MSGLRLRARERAKTALRQQYGEATDQQGYVNWPQANLVPGVRLEQFESDLRQGDGNELRMKFCAIHSSAALAVNAFAPFKDHPEDLVLLGERGAKKVEFERRMPIIAGRRPSNLDVWIDREIAVAGVGNRGGHAIAIESKLLEYFEPKKPEFADAYAELKPPFSESPWWSAYLESKCADSRHLDFAQLIKHYFGLRRYQQSGSPAADLTLLYLYWEPTNAHEIEECARHRQEVDEFTAKVAGSSIAFRSMTYLALWQEWMAIPELGEHAANLKARYEVSI